jgi:hypothetical protein
VWLDSLFAPRQASELREHACTVYKQRPPGHNA